VVEFESEFVYAVLVVPEAEVTVVGALIGYVEVEVVSQPIYHAWLLLFHSGHLIPYRIVVFKIYVLVDDREN
jgi:hypothetical protein